MEAIKDLLNEAIFHCSSSGINIKSMDSAHICMVCLNMKSEGFDKYRCDKNVSMGINLLNLSKIIKCANNNDVISIKYKDDADVVSFVFDSLSGDVSNYEINLIDIDSEHVEMPDVKYPCTVKMPALKFQKICRDLSIIGDTVTITCTKEGIKFSTGGDLVTGNIELSHNADKENDSVIVDTGRTVCLTFSLQYLNFFSKATPISDRVVLSFSEDLLLIVKYKIPYFGHLCYYLASKLKENDD